VGATTEKEPLFMTFKTQTRREFCANACQAASLAALTGALGAIAPGCGSGGSPSSADFAGNISPLQTIGATESNGTVVLAVGTGSPLATVGSAALVQTQSRFLLVGRTAQDAFTALTAICTHQTCTINGFTNQTYVCPCHGSRYDLMGQVIAGPAPFALRQYATQLANDQLTISL
jgi:cytochrome b6-f complex iron-sulfur subunit